MRDLAEETRRAYAMFNNSGRSAAPPGHGKRDWIAQAPVNAATFNELLQHAAIPVG